MSKFNKIALKLMSFVSISACVVGGVVYSSYLNDLPQDARETAKQVISSSEHQSLLKLCPTDVYSKKFAKETTTRESCEDNLLTCYNLCMNDEVSACFWTAVAFQTIYRTEDVDSAGNLVAFPLYMKACSLGDTNSCTNAAATALHGVWPSGTAPILAQTDKCQIESYLIDCTDDPTSWGCSQLRHHFIDHYPKHLKK